jgi:uncharacterized protein YkwD
MARLNQIGHTLEGVSFSQRMNGSGYASRAAGENVAQGARTPEEALSIWMQSPGHKGNILNPAYEEFGVGVATGTHDRFWTQVFAAPFPQAP